MRTRCLLLLGLVLAASGAGAQTIPKEKGPARIIGQFDFLCLKQLPELELIERAAGFGEYDQLLGEDLDPYRPAIAPEKLLAWRYHDHGDRFILVAQRAKADAQAAQHAPAFVGGTQTSCSLLVPSENPDRLLGELTRLVGRAPDKQWQEGDARAYAWLQQSAEAASLISYYMPEKAGGRASLSASLILK